MINLKKKLSARQLKVSELLRRGLAELLVSHFFRIDHETYFTLTISEVNVTSDLKIAYIFFNPFWQKKPVVVVEDDLKRIIYDDLNIIKRKLSMSINLRFMPKLIFKIDHTADKVKKIDDILKSPKVAQDL